MNTSESISSELFDQEDFLTEIAVRDQKIAARDEKIIDLDHKVRDLEEQLAWFKWQIFGKRSERVVSDLNANQLTFECFENLVTNENEKKTPVPAHERKKPKRDGKDKITFPDDLPVRTTILDISDNEHTKCDHQRCRASPSKRSYGSKEVETKHQAFPEHQIVALVVRLMI
jgi:hypothetical protein